MVRIKIFHVLSCLDNQSVIGYNQDAGSDVANIQTTANDHGSHFILNGTKSWVTSGIEADVGIIFATIGKERKHRGITGMFELVIFFLSGSKVHLKSFSMNHDK